MWFVDVDHDGATERIVVPGQRADVPMSFPLDHEMRFQTVLEEHAIPVPKVYGWLDDPVADAMEAVPGRPDFAGVAAEDRDTVVDEYLHALSAVHALPIELFIEAGIIRGKSPADAAHVGTRQFERVYRQMKVRPNPLMEFVLGCSSATRCRHGAEVVDQDRADLSALTGKAPAGRDECEEQLEKFVLADDGAHDAELVVLFNRRWHRYKALMGPEGSAMVAHHVMQPLGRSLLERTVSPASTGSVTPVT